MGEGQNQECQNTEQTEHGTTKRGLTKTRNDQNTDHTKTRNRQNTVLPKHGTTKRRNDQNTVQGKNIHFQLKYTVMFLIQALGFYFSIPIIEWASIGAWQ